METYIKDLKLSPEVKTVLSKGLQITKVSELEGHNYLTLANKCPKEYNATAIANELNELGYLYPPKNEISVYDVSMSKRLQKNLIQNNILYLSQLSINPREKILKFRNIGESTMSELDSICEKYGIQIRSLAATKEAFGKCHFPVTLLTMFFQNGIFRIEDFKGKTAYDLYVICEHNFLLTMETYYTLKKNGVIFEDWADRYLFEVLPKKKSARICRRYNITTMSQLTICNETQLKEITFEFPELSQII